MQPKFSGISGIKTFATAPSAIPIGAGEMPVEFVIKYPGDYQRISEVLDKLDAEAKKSGLFIFTNTDLRFETPQVELVIDKDRANKLGVTMQDVGTTLATLLGGNYVNRFTIDGRSYQVIPQVPRMYRDSAQWLTRYQVRADQWRHGAAVVLHHRQPVGSAKQPRHVPAAQFRDLPGRAVSRPHDRRGHRLPQEKAQELMPQGMTYDFQGESRQFVTEGNTLAITFVFALIVIYLVLAAQFESFRDPFIILIGLPASMFGALFFLFIMGEINGATQGMLPINLGSGTINIYTQIGLVTLIGLISKHGILMVEFANKLQEEQGYDKVSAIKEAAAVRLRPILMTTAAMVIGVVPLLIAEGAGATSRFDIGLVIAAGMTRRHACSRCSSRRSSTPIVAADRRPASARGHHRQSRPDAAPRRAAGCAEGRTFRRSGSPPSSQARAAKARLEPVEALGDIALARGKGQADAVVIAKGGARHGGHAMRFKQPIAQCIDGGGVRAPRQGRPKHRERHRMSPESGRA